MPKAGFRGKHHDARQLIRRSQRESPVPYGIDSQSDRHHRVGGSVLRSHARDVILGCPWAGHSPASRLK